MKDGAAHAGDALEAGDIDTAVSQFADTCYWRDLVMMTWNIKTMEGHGAISDMLGAVLGHVALLLDELPLSVG